MFSIIWIFGDPIIFELWNPYFETSTVYTGYFEMQKHFAETLGDYHEKQPDCSARSGLPASIIDSLNVCMQLVWSNCSKGFFFFFFTCKLWFFTDSGLWPDWHAEAMQSCLPSCAAPTPLWSYNCFISYDSPIIWLQALAQGSWNEPSENKMTPRFKTSVTHQRTRAGCGALLYVGLWNDFFHH